MKPTNWKERIGFIPTDVLVALLMGDITRYVRLLECADEGAERLADGLERPHWTIRYRAALKRPLLNLWRPFVIVFALRVLYIVYQAGWHSFSLLDGIMSYFLISFVYGVTWKHT